MSDDKKIKKHDCDCDDCDCDDCKCDDCECENCDCDDCDCQKEGCKHKEKDKHKNKDHCKQDRQEWSNKAQEYLALAQQIKADFENYRRHAIEDNKMAKLSGQVSVIEVFLPCLDTFKDAKKSITDDNILAGINMIEEKITSALASLGVEKVDTIGQVYDPHKHEAIASFKDDSKENNIILDEYQAGYTFGGKIIRYAKVIVNKKD